MKFNNQKQIVAAVAELRASKTGRNMHYPIMFKKALCEFIAENKKTTILHIEHITGIKQSNVYNWINQYNEGLYSEEGAYSVSKKSQALNRSILTKLDQELHKIKRKIELVKEATELGLNVT